MIKRCDEVARLVANGSYDDGGLWLRMRVRMHMLMCKHCRLYQTQIRNMGAAARACSARIGGRIEGIDRLERRIIESIRSKK